MMTSVHHWYSRSISQILEKKMVQTVTDPQLQYRMNPSISSVFYLERVGFEARVNYRHNLKNGPNLIGRNDTEGVDIGINSFHCSRKHCVLSVCDDEITVEDLNSSNGTTVNGVKFSGEKKTVKEHDIIGIVGGGNPLSELVGNFGFIVYRICKYTTDNIQTFEIEDDDPIELSDNEESDVICLDSDGELVDAKEEVDLDIQLSRNFNLEIKKELIDFEDDWEALTLHVKKENLEFASNEIDEYLYEPYEDENSNQIDETQLNDIPVDNDDSDNDSVDSNETVYFPTFSEQISDLPGCSDDKTAPLSDQTNLDSKKLKKPQLEQKLQDTVSKINESEKQRRKRGPEMIYAKPLEKRRKSKKSEDIPVRSKKKTDVATNERKERLKVAASTSSKRDEPDRNMPSTSTHTTPKVKFTPNNRGSFLTDASQMPVLPKIISKKQKEEKLREEIKRNTEKAAHNLNLGEVMLDATPTPPELVQKIWENMYSSSASQAEQLSPTKEQNIPLMENEDSGACEIDSPTNEDPDEINQLSDFIDDGVGMETEESEGNENDLNYDDDYDEELAIYHLVMKLPPETGKITVIETNPKPAHIRSILKTSTKLGPKKKRRVTFKESGFQYNPRHKIISDLTAYDCSRCDTVEIFFSSVGTDIRSFADSYEDYKEYRTTLVSLMLVELWKEIELEYINSKIHSFTSVTINDQNLEKRGEGLRMIFHCQANALYKSNAVCDDHIVLAKCTQNGEEIEFVALITSIRYSNREATDKLAYFTMETSVLTQVLPIDSLKIRPITAIANTLNSLNAVYSLKTSPLANLVINPLSEENLVRHTPENLTFKCYDTLDDTQRKILGTLYRRCINLDVPNISLLEGAAGTGKTCLIVNLALQLVYGDGLPKPLKILICSKSNGSINDLTRKLIHIRDDTAGSTKIKLVRFGVLENMDSAVQRVSVQHLKEMERHSPQFTSTSYDDLVSQRTTLELKLTALNLDNGIDHATTSNAIEKQLYKVNALIDRFQGLERKKLRDSTTFILNSCDIICTTLASIPKLQNYVSQVDVCIIDEATQCNEPLTLLPFQFGNPSLVLVGDSQLLPLAAYSPIVKSMNYGKSLFARFQKLYLGKFGSPVFEMNFQYRIQQEILLWPNHQFYKNRLVPHASVKDNSFPIAPYKVISYSLDKGVKESDNIMLVVKVLLGHVDWHAHSVGMICTNFKQNSILKNKLKAYPYIATNSAESYIGEKDVVIIWISGEHGISHLAHQQVLNAAVTRARKSLLICGANLTGYKNRPVWRSLLENANQRNCLQHFKVLTASKVCHTLSRNVVVNGRPEPKCNICKF
ncbi:helicase sen1-like isoform X2 [Bradysia coprophila]|uniref:helicase sen1-like isoform X2 n=1 Tax=Bradysia coprophila TaxID=38358 RepID=UPI00187DC31B|nr:helicase sen1-like isoform X2 [Bradysia coprophila]